MIYRILFIDKDIDYLKHLKEQIENEKIKISICKSVFEYEKSEEKNKKFDVIFVNEKIDSEIKNQNNVFVIYESKKNKGKGLFKYKKSSELYKEILEILNEIENVKNKEMSFDNPENLNSDDAKIITIYSPYGGIGKTKNSIKISNLLSNRNKTFYLELSMFSSFEFETHKDGINLINGIYSSKNLSSEKFVQKLNMKTKSLYTFFPVENPYELMKINEIEILNVIKKIKDAGFKYIVIDLDSKINYLSLELFKISSVILTFFENDRLKIRRFYNLISSDKELENIKVKIIEIRLEHNEKKNIEKFNRVLENV